MKQMILTNGNSEMLGKEQLASNSYYSWASAVQSDFCSRQKLTVDDSKGINANSIQETISGNINSSTSLILQSCWEANWGLSQSGNFGLVLAVSASCSATNHIRFVKLW